MTFKFTVCTLFAGIATSFNIFVTPPSEAATAIARTKDRQSIFVVTLKNQREAEKQAMAGCWNDHEVRGTNKKCILDEVAGPFEYVTIVEGPTGKNYPGISAIENESINFAFQQCGLHHQSGCKFVFTNPPSGR